MPGPPLGFGLQVDYRFEHLQRSGVGGRLGTTRLSEDLGNFRDLFR